MRPRSEDRGEPNRGASAMSRMASFNAATVRRPWRTGFGHAGRGDVQSASMRPRSEDRGELSFNCAWEGAAIWLQCGHGPKTVENMDVRSLPDEDKLASMRPRSE